MQSTNKIQLTLTGKETFVRRFFILFYAVGTAGMLYPPTRALFVKLIPLALLLSAGALAFTHERYTRNQVVLFGIIFLAGFIVEAAGVNSGVIFGNYRYGGSLGIKLFSTPLIIGLNWLLLVYLTASVMERTTFHPVVKIVAGSLLMTGYDVILEQVAPALDMWHWHEGRVPLQNYLSWFILALLFHSLAVVLGVRINNKTGPFLFVCQTVFFILLFIFLF